MTTMVTMVNMMMMRMMMTMMMMMMMMMMTMVERENKDKDKDKDKDKHSTGGTTVYCRLLSTSPTDHKTRYTVVLPARGNNDSFLCN